MKVLVDCRYVKVGRHDGISRFTAELVHEIVKTLPVEVLINDERQLAHLPEGIVWHKISSPTSWKEPFVAFQIRPLKPDVVFSPMQTMGSLGRNYPLILTLHDLIYYQNPTPPRDLPAPVRALWRLFHMAWWPQRLLLNRSDHVVTVSDTSKNLILQHRLTKRPVSVVSNAASPLSVEDQEHVEQRDPLSRERNLVYMGSFMPYKNVETLAKMMGLLPGYTLHLLSRISPTDRARLSKAASAFGPGKIIFHDGVSDEDYFELLRNATALVSASHDEGFGIPLVESMSLGTPVIVSDIPVFREVAGQVGAYVHPDDAKGFAEEILLLEDDDIWTQRSLASRRQANTFDWGTSAQELIKVLSQVSSAERQISDRD